MASQAASMRRSRDLKDAQDLAAAETQKAAHRARGFSIPARASAQGKLFGSVGPVEVAAAITSRRASTSTAPRSCSTST